MVAAFGSPLDHPEDVERVIALSVSMFPLVHGAEEPPFCCLRQCCMR